MPKINQHRLQQRLKRLTTTGQKDLLYGSLIGLEKESLRVSPGGVLAQTPHPAALGSALTNEFITTDYSEALTEFITPPLAGHEALPFLQDLQKFAHNRIGDEIFWATSMPCVVEGESRIPIAQYGSSNLGMMKTVYRRGLGHRYGRMMQVIAGVHFNYSLPEPFWPVYQEMEAQSGQIQDFKSDSYFAMIRNLQRYGWLITYLFGASPAVCKSFLKDQQTDLLAFNENTLYEPLATSLRMGDIGYQNSREDEFGIKACYDNLACYIDSLTRAIETPCPVFNKIGVRDGDRYEQLNSNILQIENEYYSSVRPKQVLQGNEKPTLALKHRGVQYVELRSLDINIFDPLGINEEQLYFLEAFLVFCLLEDSPAISDQCRVEIDRNALVTAHQGRNPALELQHLGENIRLQDWAARTFDAMQGVCEILDIANNTEKFSQALKNLSSLLGNPDATPSGRILAEMTEYREGFFHYAMQMSKQHSEYFKTLTLAPERQQQLQAMAEDSIKKQQALEAENNIDFGEFLQAYFDQK